MKQTLKQQAEQGTIGMKSARKHKIITEVEDKAKHAESSLHLQFCKWLKATYPHLQFVRHEREKFRGYQAQNMMKVYNSELDKLPDFELLAQSGVITPYNQLLLGFRHAFGLYIEFKKPGRTITITDGITIKSEFLAQYKCHTHLWSIGRCAYFCNDLEKAKKLLIDYLDGKPQPMQRFTIPVDKKDYAADIFFSQFNL